MTRRLSYSGLISTSAPYVIGERGASTPPICEARSSDDPNTVLVPCTGISANDAIAHENFVCAQGEPPPAIVALQSLSNDLGECIILASELRLALGPPSSQSFAVYDLFDGGAELELELRDDGQTARVQLKP